MCNALLKELEILKISPSAISATANKFITTKKTKEAVSTVEINVIKQKQLNQTYSVSTTHILPKFSIFVVVKFKL